jgi:hypothetical protein
MRKIAFFIYVVLCLNAIGLFAQTTGNFNYQAVIRDSNGDLVTNQAIDLQLTIIESSTDGSEVYRETHNVTTSGNGMISLIVGNGTSDLGDFNSINWGNDLKFIKIEIDQGDGFIEMGTFQLFSVPYNCGV